MPLNDLDPIKYQYYFMLLKLLSIGIPYDKIEEMEEEEILTILAINMAIEEKQHADG